MGKLNFHLDWKKLTCLLCGTGLQKPCSTCGGQRELCSLLPPCGLQVPEPSCGAWWPRCIWSYFGPSCCLQLIQTVQGTASISFSVPLGAKHWCWGLKVPHSWRQLEGRYFSGWDPIIKCFQHKKNRKPNRKQGSFCFNYSKFTSCQRLTKRLLVATCRLPDRTLQDKLLLLPSRQLPVHWGNNYFRSQKNEDQLRTYKMARQYNARPHWRGGVEMFAGYIQSTVGSTIFQWQPNEQATFLICWHCKYCSRGVRRDRPTQWNLLSL